MRYQVTQSPDTGRWLVVDTLGTGLRTVAAGMAKDEAEKLAARLNLRAESGQ